MTVPPVENPRVRKAKPALHARDELTCEACGHQQIVNEIYEPDTGMYYLSPEDCPECGGEWA